MAKQRRSFSTEFKREAASLVLDQGHSLAEAGHSLSLAAKNSFAPKQLSVRLFNQAK